LRSRAGTPLGYSVAGFSKQPLTNLRDDIIRGSALAVGVVLLASLGLALYFTRRTLAPIREVAAAARAVARGDLATRVDESRWDELGDLARSFNRMTHGLAERDRLRDLFARYLSPAVSEAVIAGRVSLEGQRRVVTILFCDVRGSTAFAEAHPPEVVLATLNDYFRIVIHATETEHGIVARFLGDAVLCLFGAPVEYADHADRALRAALQIRAGFDRLTQSRAAAGLPTLQFGIALNTGPTTVGATGSEQRQEYTAIGDPVNIAARIEKMTKDHPDCAVLLSRTTQEALHVPALDLVAIGDLTLAGRSQPVGVVGVRRTPTPAEETTP
jgi:class 3 adenylate cyclase